MTALFDHAVEAARALPSSIQDDVARLLLLQLAGQEQPGVEMSDEEFATFATSLGQADDGKRATDDQVRAVWAKHRL